MNKLSIFTGVLAAIILASCTNNKKDFLFKADLKKTKQGKTLTYVPAMEFAETLDSLHLLLEPADFNKILGGPIKMGDYLYQDEAFKLRIFVVENYNAISNPKFQLVLRTYSPDMKIIDSFILANTTGEHNCSGYITNDLKVYKSCEDDSEYLTEVNEYGEFITQENE